MFQHQQQNPAATKNGKRIITKPTSAAPKGMAPAPPKNLPSNQSQLSAIEQKNRSLTVMIPRAKYKNSQEHLQAPQQMHTPPIHHHHHYVQKSENGNNSNGNKNIMQSGVATATQGAATMFTTTSSTNSTRKLQNLPYFYVIERTLIFARLSAMRQ